MQPADSGRFSKFDFSVALYQTHPPFRASPLLKEGAADTQKMWYVNVGWLTIISKWPGFIDRLPIPNPCDQEVDGEEHTQADRCRHPKHVMRDVIDDDELDGCQGKRKEAGHCSTDELHYWSGV